MGAGYGFGVLMHRVDSPCGCTLWVPKNGFALRSMLKVFTEDSRWRFALKIQTKDSH